MPINPAILGHGVEFFVSSDELFAIVNGHTYTWHECPGWVKQELALELEADAHALAALTNWGLEGDAQLRQFAVCRKGSFNQTPDLGEHPDSEYYDCGNRGKCPYEGKICQTIKLSEGMVIGFREIQVLRLIIAGLLDKEIACKMDISVNTVTTHVQNLLNKTNQHTRTALAVWALKRGIM